MSYRSGGKSGYEGQIAGLYDLGATLGKGHYAVVKAAKHVFTGEKVHSNNFFTFFNKSFDNLNSIMYVKALNKLEYSWSNILEYAREIFIYDY